MKTHILTVLWLALSAFSVSGYAATLKKTDIYRFNPPSGRTVEVFNVNGSIHITGWDSAVVKVVAHKTIRAGSARAAQKAAEQLTLQSSEHKDRLVIRVPSLKHHRRGFLKWLQGAGSSASVGLEVYVPRTTNVHASTINGRIEIQRVDGRHRLKTSNGRIEGRELSGSLEAQTSNGLIYMALNRVFPGKSVKLATFNGDIEVLLSDTAQFKVIASTSNGRIRSDFPMTIHEIQGYTTLEGDVGKARFTLILKTSNGDIRLKQLQGNGKANTLGDWLNVARDRLVFWFQYLRTMTTRDSLQHLLKRWLHGASERFTHRLTPAPGTSLHL